MDDDVLEKKDESTQAQDKEEALDARDILDDMILFLESFGLIVCFFYLLHNELNMFIVLQQEDIRNYIEDSIKHGVHLSAFRKERIGGDSHGISYW